jgi:mono/diheme cytochrome c family protein
MRNLLWVALFSLGTVAFFAGYSNWGIPQIIPAPPPIQEQIDLGAMTMDQFVALGGRIVGGRGTCLLCHNAVGGRAPLLENLGAATAKRLDDTRYQGKATDTASYLYESMVDPSAYVVAGFGKAGTRDTVSPMPNVRAGSIKLSEAEILAVVAYLQDASGLEVSVDIPKDVPADAEEETEARPAAKSPAEIITAFDCGTCHKIGGADGEVGPDLRTVGARRDRAFLRRAILLPNADVTKGFEPDLMPDDYGEQIYAGELEMLLDYMVGLK